MPKEVIISNSSVNSYGFRVLTSGIDVEQYKKNPILLWMHNRAFRGTTDDVLPIGKIDNIRVDGDNLIGTPVFDENDEFAKKIETKWNNGLLKMVSAGLDIIELSEDPQYLLQGQTRETITKSKLVEVSIVDIGANDDALALYDNNKRIKLSQGDDCDIKKIKLNKNTNQNEKKMNKIALQLGLKENATELEIMNKIAELQLSADEVKALKKKIAEQEESAIKQEVSNAVKMKKITEDKKEYFLSLGKKIGLKDLSETLACMSATVKPTDLIKDKSMPEAKKLSELSNEDKIQLREENKEEYIRLYKAEYGIEPDLNKE